MAFIPRAHTILAQYLQSSWTTCFRRNVGCKFFLFPVFDILIPDLVDEHKANRKRTQANGRALQPGTSCTGCYTADSAPGEPSRKQRLINSKTRTAYISVCICSAKQFPRCFILYSRYPTDGIQQQSTSNKRWHVWAKIPVAIHPAIFLSGSNLHGCFWLDVGFITSIVIGWFTTTSTRVWTFKPDVTEVWVPQS